MASEVIDENQMEHYLLGLLPEDKASLLEERGLADYGFFEHLLVVENRLIDDYLTKKLSPQDHVQFEKYFLFSPKRRERVECARSFLKSMSELSTEATAPVPKTFAVSEARVAAEEASWLERLQSFFGFKNLGFGLAAAAAMLLLAFAGWSFWESRRVREELAQIKRERTDLQQREQDLQARLNSQQGQNEELRKEIERNRAEVEQLKAEEARLQAQAQASPSIMASLTLKPPKLRDHSPGQSPQLAINANTRSARLTVVVDKELIGKLLESYPNVRAELSSGGKIQWSQEGLTPRIVKAGKAFVITLPAERLSASNYQMRLVGSGFTGETVLADYQFKVVKK